VANQGFSLTGVSPAGFNINGVVITAPTPTTFTFSLASPPSYVSGGNVKPAKEAVVLNVNTAVPGAIQVQYVLWLTTLFPVAVTGGTSQWKGAAVQENAAIAAGSTIEVPRSHLFPNTFSEASIEAFMAADFASQQAALASSTQPGQFYGVYFDGTGWSG
jgi:hypothetical protein